MTDVVAGPDLQMNVLRYRKRAAVHAAERAVDALVPTGGDVAADALRLLEAGAWVSGSSARATFVQELSDAGRAVAAVWGAQVEQCRGEWAAEPVQVDRNDPREGWKSSVARVEGRVMGEFHGSVAW